MDDDLLFLSETLSQYLSPHRHKAFLFGSRAEGTNALFSDFDIAIEGESLAPELYFEILAAFEDSDFPYKVDVVQKHDMSDDFLEVASTHMIPIPLSGKDQP